jgi:L-threonylcarbamoyladenylate synthase
MDKVKAIDPNHPDRSLLSRAAAVIRDGGVVAFPTDTFYGLAADPFNSIAVDRLFEIKGRDRSKPILLLIAEIQSLDALVEEVPPFTQEIIRRFWPGPLTLVFKASRRLPDSLTAGSGKIGVRFPNAPVSLRLIETAGFPLTATSANRSGAPSPASAHDVARQLAASVDLILDAGPCSTLPSTVLDITVHPPAILREGKISAGALSPWLGEGVRR